jgi:CO/xanthine dehydrogenase FAD-binding subunit
VGKKCVAAHSADTPPVLWALDAEVDLVGPDGERTVPVREFFVADGSWNTVRRREEIVRRLRVPVAATARAQAYAKLRLRKAIDFPLLSVAVAAALEGDRVGEVRLVVSALGARPREVAGLERLAGRPLDEVAEAAAELAWRQCHPLENLPVDPEWRRAMVPVYVRRAFAQLRSN